MNSCVSGEYYRTLADYLMIYTTLLSVRGYGLLQVYAVHGVCS